MRPHKIRWIPAWSVALPLAILWVALFVPGWAVEESRVYAQTDFSYLYIEPGTTILRDPGNGGQIQGKVVIDRRNGDAWGFPTATSAPFPVVLSTKEPPVSKPIYLGRFDFAAIKAR